MVRHASRSNVTYGNTHTRKGILSQDETQVSLARTMGGMDAVFKIRISRSARRSCTHVLFAGVAQA